MRPQVLLSCLLACFTLLQASILAKPVTKRSTWTYPAAQRVDKTFTYKSKAKGQVTVADPYFWLETPATQSADTKTFADAQNAFTQTFIDKCTDLNPIRQKLNDASNYPQYSTPFAVGFGADQVYYYTLTQDLQRQPTWYKATKQELLQAEQNGYSTPPGQKFFDPNLLSKDGTVVLFDIFFSTDGKRAAYSLSQSGSDWRTIYFRNTDQPFVSATNDDEVNATGGPNRLPDVLENVRYSSFDWDLHDVGVTYQRYNDRGSSTDAANFAELYYHVMGTEQEQDILLMAKEPNHPELLWSGSTSWDGKWIVVGSTLGSTVGTRVYVAPLSDGKITADLTWISISPSFDYSLYYIDNIGNDFYFTSDKDAPNWKVVRATIDPTKAKKIKSTADLTDTVAVVDVVPNNKNAFLSALTQADGHKIIIWYLEDAKYQLFQYDLVTGKQIGRIMPDLIGTVDALSTRWQDEDAFLTVTSFDTPSTVYRLQWSDGGKDPNALPTISTHRKTNIKGLDLSTLVTKQVFVASQDGAQIPVYLVYFKDTPLDGTAPAWLYFYGGFGAWTLPTYDPNLLTWMRYYRGVLVWVLARGGGEYGEAWHLAGSGLHKINTFNDVIAAAQYVVDNKVAAKGKIIVNGVSNGGMCAMAVGLRAPEGLFGSIVAEAGYHDMLRFNQFTAGAFWVQEYGSPQDPVAFDYLYSYSPLHNVASVKQLPFTLLTTADHDDRVPPLHSYKMVAELQHQLAANPNALLLRIESDAGHGETSLQKVLEDTSIKYCLTANALGLKNQS